MKMKKRTIILIGLLLITVLAGCTKQNEENREDEKVNIEVTTSPTPTYEVVLTPTEQDNKEEDFYKKGFKENWEVIGQTDIKASNVGLNIRRGFERSIADEVLPICYSAEYDVLYYVNYSDNSFIYRLKDGEIKVAVQIPAEHLYMNKGELYFRVVNISEGLEGVEVGDVCKYLPLTGEVQKVIEGAGAEWMTVAETGIYYEVGTDTFYYDLETKKSEKLSAWPKKLIWKDGYSVVPYSSSLQGGSEGFIGLGLHKIGDKMTNVEPVTLDGMADSFCVQGDILYCQNGEEGTFKIIDLNTGEMEQYQVKKGKKNAVSMSNFVVKDNRVYCGFMDYFVDLETGKHYDLERQNLDVYGSISMQGLFIANDKIYALVNTSEIGGKRLTKGELLEVVLGEEIIMSTLSGTEFLEYTLKRIGE